MDVGESGGGLTEGRCKNAAFICFFVGGLGLARSLFGVEGRILEARDSERGQCLTSAVVSPTARLMKLGVLIRRLFDFPMLNCTEYLTWSIRCQGRMKQKPLV